MIGDSVVNVMKLDFCADLLANRALRHELVHADLICLQIRSFPFSGEGLHGLYAVIALCMWCGAFLFSREYLNYGKLREESGKRFSFESFGIGSHKLYYISFFVTLLATLGVFLSDDLYTLFIFFEIMSLASYVFVAIEENKAALRAAETYLAVAVIGGLVMLMGLFMLYHLAGTLEIGPVMEYAEGVAKEVLAKRERTNTVSVVFENREYRDLFFAGFCMLFGFGAKAGAFPLHIWLPKAHPVAPAPLSALLSGILTKAGVFGVFILSCDVFRTDELWGSVVFIVGILTMLTGAVLAIFSIDLKRTLACSSVSQIGFILTGAGVSCLLKGEGNIPVSGALLHAVNHSFFKLVLFLCAGAVYMNLHELDLNRIRGFGRNKKALKLAFFLASFGIMGVPLFSGYISKTLIHEGIVEYKEALLSGEIAARIFSPGFVGFCEGVFLFSGGCTVAYMMKLYIAIFVERNADPMRQRQFDEKEHTYMTPLSKAVILIPAFLFPLCGLFPGLFMERLSLLSSNLLHTEPLAVSWFSASNLAGSLISIGIGAVLYFGFVRPVLMKGNKSLWPFLLSEDGVYLDLWPKALDLEDRVYRPLLLTVLPSVFGFICRVLDSLVDFLVVGLRRTVYKDAELPEELPEGTRFTNFSGKLMDKIYVILNHTLWRREPRPYVDHAHLYAMRREEFGENEFIVLRSMSFGLILFCLGLLVTVAYLLVH
ncbi:MAG: sodium:proton antiporter [Lachnospiraceae bacterium]|nr:sodium:proton antiporter [Lachnospiraceae bacterium]